MPYVTRIAVWNATLDKFSDYEPTPHKNKRDAQTCFNLTVTCIKNAAKPMPRHTGSRCTGIWAFTRVEFVKPNGVVLQSFALPGSARRAIAAGRPARLKHESAAEPTDKRKVATESLAVVAQSDKVVPTHTEPAQPAPTNDLPPMGKLILALSEALGGEKAAQVLIAAGLHVAA